MGGCAKLGDTAAMTLDEVRDEVFRALGRGAAHPRSGYRSPALATVDQHGRPRLRTVILRGFDPLARRLTLHSDIRAAKITELATCPHAALHIWNARAQVQIRLEGRAAVRAGDAARDDWARLPPHRRAAYTVKPTPGTPLDDPAEADRDRFGLDAGFVQFAAIDLVIDRLEWLHLGRGGHRRARFTWTDGERAAWLVP